MSEVSGATPLRVRWSYDHFLCLLLLYASYEDYEYSEDEKKHILTYVKPSILAEVESVFNTLGEYERLDLILKLKGQFITSKDEKENILYILKNHFSSDGDYSKLESSLYKFLNKLL